MGWLVVVINGVATLLFFASGHTAFAIIAIAATIGSIWSWGVMHKYATEVAKTRKDYTGKFYDVREQEIDAVPDWIAHINMLFALMGFVLFITAVVLTIF
jgi:hypothetical protein